jgi:hypothetical protein
MTVGSVRTPDETVDLADTAVAYAKLGWRIFPVVPGGKIPQHRRAHDDDGAQRACPGGHVCGRLGHGFKDATADPDRVARWWARQPGCNIGLATGNPHGVDVGSPGASPDVLDIDVKDGAPGLASLARLQWYGYTRGVFAVAGTPSGGWHLYFDGTIQSSATLKKHGVDFRSCGGYVVAPGSRTGTRRHPRPYRWMPDRWDLAADGTVDWADIRDFLNPPPLPRNLMFTAFTDSASPLIDWFVQQPSGSRNNALYWAACRILESGYPTERLDDLATEGRRAGLTDGEVQKTITSAIRKIMGGGV